MSRNQTQEPAWRFIAWNGIAFEAPSAWEIGVIEPRYLLLEIAGKPVVEIKWNRIRGRFSARRMLRRLSSGQRPAVRKSLRNEPLPAPWAQALADRQHSGFAWQTADAAGRGVLMFCPQCSTAALIQFRDPPRSHDLQTRLLQSFRDHFSGDGTPWSVYDIAAVIPDDYNLQTYRLDAGRFELAYTAPDRSRLRLFRWAPASILLQDGGLTEFFALRMGADPQTIRANADRSLEVNAGREPPALLRWMRNVRTQPIHRRMRIWHLPEHNRILGVRLEGFRPLDPQRFEWICDHYAVV